MVFERKKLKSAKLKKPLILHIKWLLFDQFNIKRLIFWVYMDSCMCIVVVQISVQKCVCLNYNKVPTLLTVDTKIDQKWSKMTKKSTKKGSVHCLKISLKSWNIRKWCSLNCSFDTNQIETGVPLFDKTVRDFPSKTMFFRHFFVNDLARFNWGHYLKISLKPWKRQKKMVLELFFRHHPKRNWGTPVWQNGAWFSVKNQNQCFFSILLILVFFVQKPL